MYKKFSQAIVQQAVSSLLNFLVALFFARYLGISEFGIYSLCFFSAMLLLSFQGAFVYTTMLVDVAKQNGGARVFKIAAFKSTLAACLGFATAFALFYSGAWRGSILVLCLYLLSFIFSDLLKKIALSEMRYKLVLTADLCQGLGFAFFFFLLHIGLLPSNAHAALMACSVVYISISAFVYFFCFILQSRSLRINLLDRNYYTFTKEELKKTFPLIISCATQWANGRTPLFILNYIAGPLLVGGVSASISLCGFLNPLMLSLDNYILPHTSRVFTLKGHTALKSELNKIFKWVGIFMIVLIVLMQLLANNLYLLVLGELYLPYVSFFSFVLFSYLLQLAAKKYQYYFNVIEKQKYLARAAIFSLCSIATGGAFFIHWLGAYGALLSINLGHIVYLSGLVIYAHKNRKTLTC